MRRIVIPARMASERLPGKPLAMIGDKTLLEHVYSRCIGTEYPITVLTDSVEILERYPNWDVRITDTGCQTGTDRIASVIDEFAEDTIINCQGDLPFIDPCQIIQAADTLDVCMTDVATLVFEMDQSRQQDPNTVKAICTPIMGEFMRAHWFGRSAVQYGYQHVGVYAYRKESLASLPKERSKLESIENLEQLRFLEYGMSISAFKTYEVPGEVNTQEDLEAAIARYK